MRVAIVRRHAYLPHIEIVFVSEAIRANGSGLLLLDKNLLRLANLSLRLLVNLRDVALRVERAWTVDVGYVHLDASAVREFIFHRSPADIVATS